MPRVSDYAQSYNKYYTGGVIRKEYMDGLTAASWGALANIVMAHSTDDGFYAGKDTADPKQMAVPALIIGGWWDIHDTPKIYNSVLALVDSEIAGNIRMLICPSDHSMIAKDGPVGELEYPGAGEYARNEQKKFFDYWLRGVDSGFTFGSPVTYYEMGSNRWRTATQWPPAGMQETSYYLHDGGLLTASSASASVAPLEFKFDPDTPVPADGGNIFNPGLNRGPIDQSKIVERHKDVLIFASEELAEDVAIAGEISAILYVSSDAVDTDVAIRVTDVYPDGRSMLVRDGIQRLSHLEGDDVEKFITPGTVYPVTVKTYSVGQTFVKGHRIRLIVSASNYPRFGVNNGQEDRSKAPVKITDKLYFDAEHPSALVLPVVSN
jgi:putative CocE/NonD family hydrolase